MADDPTPDAPTSEPLGEAGLKALEAERATVKDLKRQIAELKPLAEAAQKAEDANKTEVQRLTDQVAALTRDAETYKAEAARFQVAIDKKLTPTQARRLQGSTVDELAADADQLLADLGIARGDAEDTPEPTPAPGNRQEQLKGGIDPTTSDTSSADIRGAVDAAFKNGF